MPNQYNFRSDVTNISDPRITASRLSREPNEGVISEIIPASFGFEIYDNIELHFYTISSDELVLSTVINLDEDADVVKSHVVTYDDGTFKNYIRIDFTELFVRKNIILAAGEYRVVMNFFSDEIGSYDNRKLYIQQASESRTEIQLAFFPTNDGNLIAENNNDFFEFITPSFNKPTAIGVAEKIFESGIRLEDSTEGVTYETVEQNIEIPNETQTFDNTIARVQRLGDEARQQFENSIEEYVVSLFETIKNEIIINGDRRIQEIEFREFINNAVDQKLHELQQKLGQNILVR